MTTPTTPQDHELFRRFPLVSRQTLAVGEVTLPAHIYASRGVFIGGRVNLAALSNLLQTEDLTPIRDASGYGLMSLDVLDVSASNLGETYREVQITFYAARQPVQVIAHPFSILRLLDHTPEARLLVHGLWTEHDTVRAYHNEVLGLGARRGECEWRTHDNGDKRQHLHVTDLDSGEMVLEGDVLAPFTDWVATRQMMGLFGLGNARQVLAPTMQMTQQVNRSGFGLPHSADALRITHADQQRLHRYDAERERLTLGDDTYAALTFQPDFVLHVEGYKRVLLNPHNVGDEAQI